MRALKYVICTIAVMFCGVWALNVVAGKLLARLQSKSFKLEKKLELLAKDGVLSPSKFLAEGAEIYWGKVRYHPYRWYALPASYNGEFHRTDESGFRIRPIAESSPNPAKPISIGFFGGSTAYSTTTTYSNSIPAKLEALMKDQVVGNFGIGGYSLAAEMLTFLEVVRRNPQMKTAVFYDGVNEVLRQLELVQQSAPLSWYSAGGFPYLASVRAGLRNEVPFFGMRNNIVRLLEDVYDRASIVSKFSARVKTTPPSYGDLATQIADNYNAQVKEVSSLCNVWNVKCYFILQPNLYFRASRSPWEDELVLNRYKTWLDVQDLYLASYKEISRKMVASRDVQFYDLSSALSNCRPGEDVFYDECHVMAAGNSCIANSLSAIIR